MYKLVIVGILMFSTSVFGETIYFHSDTEGNVEDQSCSNGGWNSSSNDPPSVRKTTGPEPVYAGSYSLRHTVIGHDSWAGKVYRWFLKNNVGNWGCDGIEEPYESFPNEEAYFSSWFYLETDTTNDYARNFIQWKVDDYTGTDGIRDVIFFMGPRYIDSKIQLTIDATGGYAYSCKLSDGDFPDYQWLAGNPCWFRQKSDIVVEFPRQQWVHVEAYVKMTDGDAVLKVWQDGVLIFYISDPDFNLLHGYDSGVWSNNTGLTWGIGAYQNPLAQPQELILYTDDAMVTDYPVHQKLGLGSSSLSRPANLRIGSSSP